MKEEERGGGSDLDLDPDPDPWKIFGSGFRSGKMMQIFWFRVRIRNNGSNAASLAPIHGQQQGQLYNTVKSSGLMVSKASNSKGGKNIQHFAESTLRRLTLCKVLPSSILTVQASPCLHIEYII